LTTSATQTTTPAAQQVPAPTANLKPGDTGAQVKVLQRALASLGFSTGKIDGQYGSATQAAVERFQRSAGLKADGIVGPTTLAALATALRGA
jgi:peptidoglycan hydrolase-like protein with peptidoglycan-binding domain